MLCLDLKLTNKEEELVGHVKIGGSLGCSDHEMVKFRDLRGGARQIAGLQPWTSEERTLACSGICLEDSYEIQFQKKECSSRSGWLSRIVSSKLKNGSSSVQEVKQKHQEACMDE